MKLGLNSPRVVFFLAIVMIIGIAISSFLLYTDAENYLKKTAERKAQILSSVLADFRVLYTSEVVARVEAQGIEVSHDYKNKEGAIPLPATMTELLASRVGISGKGQSARLYSDYPFPWKKDGGVKDTFERDALAALKENPTVAFHRVDMLNGVETYRYATADVMRESCVNCHNAHPQTPKRDWKVGDVRGALEVSFPMDHVATSSDNSTLLNMVIIILLALFSIFIMLGSLFRLARERKNLQQKVEERTAEVLSREQNLIDEKSRLSAVIDNIVDGIVTIDKKGYIETFNAAAENIFGYREEEIIGENVKILMPEPYHSEHDGYLDHHNRTGEKKVIGIGREVIGQRKDGSTFPMELRVSAISINEVQHFVGIIREISERKQAELALKKASRRLTVALKSAHMGIWELDIASNELLWDERMFEIYGLNSSTFSGAYEGWYKGLYPEDKARAIAEFKEALEDPKQNFDTEFRVLRPNGEIRTVKAWGSIVRDENEKAVHVIGINMDISEQKEAENKALGVKEELEGVFNSVLDGLVIIDEKGKVAAFNPAAENIFGYSEKEVIGKNVKMLMPEPYHSEHDGYLSNYMNGGKAKVIGIGREVEGRRKDGSTFPLHLGVTKSKNYGLPQYVGMVRDLTEQKRLEKLKNEFVSTVSHELRTPLTSIRGSLSLIDSGVMGEVGDKVSPLVQIALNNSERLILLINDILDMEKIESGMMDFELVQTDLGSIIEEAVEFNEGYAKAHEVNLSFAKHDEKIPVYIDLNRMQQVLSNLISNAVKYSPKHDTVTLRVTVKKRLVHFEVHDNGPGIPESFKKRIFQKFAQADASDTKQKGGTGLGLNISKAIVEKFGGTIGFFSPPGQGTTFFFDLPIITEVTSSDALIAQARGKVLIVEDQHDIATLIRIMLEHEDLECDIAYNAKEAKLLLQKNKYDAMTLDIMLPDQDGISLLEEIRKEEMYHDLAVIVVSAKALASKDENTQVALEVVDWVNKPIDQKQLMMSLNNVIASNESVSPRILHVEDDPDIAQVVKLLIGDIGEIDLATSKAEAMKKLGKHEKYNLILLDMMLPDGSSEELLPYIKEHYSTTPVVLFTAQEVDNKLKEQVSKALVKSRTSNELLVETIKKIIEN